MDYYIKPSYEDRVRLNDILFTTFMYRDGQFIPPFTSGDSYLNVDMDLYKIDQRMGEAETHPDVSTEDKAFITELYSHKKTEAEAIEAGWLPPPEPSPE